MIVRTVWLALIAAGVASQAPVRAATVETVAAADTYVKQSTPDANFGTNGALSVAGASAQSGGGGTVGLADTFLRFDISAVVAALDAEFGNHAWSITGVVLRVVEFTAPPNNSFGRGQGTFAADWIADDTWGEATLTWNTAADFLDAGADVPLGEFENLFVGDQYTPVQRFGLALADELTADIRGGGLVSLHLSAADAAIGFTFNSSNITGTRPKPYLEVTAVPEPCAAVLLLAGALLGFRRKRWL